MPQPLRVLIVEDRATDAELVVRELRRAGFAPDWHRVDTEAEFTASLHPDLDIILADWEMPEFSGPRALEILHEQGLEIPFIIVSGIIGEDTAVAAMKEGATDYLLKDRMTRLGPAVAQALDQCRLRKESAQAEEAMRQSEHKYRHLFESLSEAAFLIECSSRRIVDVNRSAEELLGRTRSEILGKDDRSLFFSGAAAAHGRGLAGDGTTTPRGPWKEAAVVTKDGRQVPVQISVAPVELYGRHLVLALMTDITERKQAEAALRESEERFRQLAENIQDVFWLTDIDTNQMLYVSPAYESVWGRCRAELYASPQSWFDVLHPDDRERFFQSATVNQAAGIYDEEYRIIRPDGSVRWIRDRAFPVVNAAGEVDRVAGVARDITDQKAAEEALRQSEAEFRAMTEASPLGIFVADGNGLVTYTNGALRQMLGADFQQIAGRGWAESVHPLDRAELLARWQEATAHKRNLESNTRFIRSDGTTIQTRIRTAVMREHERVLGYVAVVEDITASESARKKIEEQAAMLDQAHDAISVRGFHDRKVRYWNKGAENLYGWAAGDAIGRTIDELIGIDPGRLHDVEEHLLKTGKWYAENRQHSKSGKGLMVSTRATLIRDATGEPKAVLSINTDITEQKDLEGRILRAQRMESLGTLAGGIAHDLNNTLGPIILSLELLKMKFPDPPGQELIEIIASSAQRGADMVRQVLSFARGVEGRRMELQVKHLIRDIEKIINETFLKHITVQTAVPNDLWTVLGDPTQLHQVLLNLCVNARDAMPDGGTLIITAENCVLDEHYAGLNLESRPGPHVLLQVEDTGTGMPPEIIEKIFDPFFTMKEVGKGTGLGLSTSLAIVKSHGGFLRVDSEVGKGTKFRVFLPAQAEPSPETAAAIEAEMPRGQGEWILVVDDESSVRQITQQTLEAFGYRVVLASDGTEAVALCANRGAEIAALITDMMMPGIDGPTTIQILRKMYPKLPVVAASGLWTDHQMAKARALGVKHFLSKPYTADTLLKVLREILAGTR